MANEELRTRICIACNTQFSDEPCEPSECDIRRIIDNLDPESLRPKGRWEIHCLSNYDSWTQETDENFYLECSECKRQVWDVDQIAAMNSNCQKLIEKYPYCHCGCKMEGVRDV